MAGERSAAAIERIERALSRIEASAARPPSQPDQGELRDLRDTHQALRQKVEAAIADIDRLIHAGERR